MSLIAQAVNYGSCFDAIYSGEVKVQELLAYLASQPLDSRSLHAYRAVCQFSTPSRHYLQSGKHFLVEAPHYEYIALYIAIHGDLTIPSTLQGGPPLNQALRDKITGLDTKPHIMERVSYMVTPVPMFLLTDSFTYIDDVIACRSVQYFKDMSPLSKITAVSPERFLNYDLLIALANFPPERYRDKLIDRIELLATKAPLYWTKVIMGYYRRLLVETFLQDPILLTKSQALRVDRLMPGLIEPWYLELTDEVWKLLKLSSVQRAYLLGYGIDNTLSPRELKETMKLLSREGIDCYCKRLAERNLWLAKELNRTPIYSEVELVNEEDTLCERPEDYSPFDVVYLRKDNLVFRFTRPEFPNLLETKSNPWNKEELPALFLVQLANRLSTAELVGLPDPVPLKDALTNR